MSEIRLLIDKLIQRAIQLCLQQQRQELIHYLAFTKELVLHYLGGYLQLFYRL